MPRRYIEYPGKLTHYVAAFLTVDRGLSFTKPHHEDKVKVRRVISCAKENWYNEPRCNDTIDKVVIVL